MSPRTAAYEISSDCTEAANARRLAEGWGDRLRWVKEWGWLVFTGRRWERDTTNAPMRWALDVASALHLEGLRFAAGSDERKHLLQWAMQSETARVARATVDLASTEERLIARPEDFDANPVLLNCLNGPLRFQDDFFLYQHHHRFKLTKLAGAEYEKDARSNLWESFLESQIPDAGERIFLQKAMGAALISPREERVYFLTGPGGSGKGTFCNAIKGALGEYCATSDPEIYATDHSREYQLEMARLRGMRIVLLPELGADARLAMRLLKQVSGRDSVRAREHHKQAFDYTPTFTFFISTNFEPRLDSFDERRIVVIGFDNPIPVEKQDPGLKEKLSTWQEHRTAVLSWIVEGVRLYQEDGSKLTVPEKIRIDTKAWKDSHDGLAEFIDARCELGNGSSLSARALRDAYEQWCAQTGEKPESTRRIAQRLRTLHCTPGKDRDRTWTGIGLKPLEEVNSNA